MVQTVFPFELTVEAEEQLGLLRLRRLHVSHRGDPRPDLVQTETEQLLHAPGLREERAEDLAQAGLDAGPLPECLVDAGRQIVTKAGRVPGGPVLGRPLHHPGEERVAFDMALLSQEVAERVRAALNLVQSRGHPPQLAFRADIAEVDGK